MRAAASLAGIALVCGWLGLAWLDGRMATDPGELRHMTLADGSELDIAPNTRLRVKFDAGLRRLELDEGQIAVSVATDSQRPFEVAAGGGLIRDIGTRFEVSTGRERTHVVVAEGMVEISVPAMGNSTAQLRVGAGEEVEFDGWKASPVRRVDAATSLGWTRGHLEFDATSLVDIAAALNRYRRMPIKLGDPTLRRIRISGVFLIDDEVGALRAIERVAPVRFELNVTQQAWEAWPAQQAR
jgi:transmembrane sensor